MFCKNCGKEIKDTIYYCQYCGSQTHKGYATKKIKKGIAISGMIFVFLFFVLILVRVDLFGKISRSIHDKQQCSSIMHLAEKNLKDFDFNAVKISRMGNSATFVFEDDEFYVTDGTIGKMGNFLIYSKDGVVYKSSYGEAFKELKGISFKKEILHEILKDVQLKMELPDDYYSDSYITFKGELKNPKSLSDTYGSILNLLGTSAEYTDVKEVSYVLKVYNLHQGEQVSRVDLSLTIAGATDCNFTYETKEVDIKSVFKDTFVKNYNQTLSETIKKYKKGAAPLTCYLSDTDSELIIREKSIFVNDQLMPEISLDINGKPTIVSYDEVIIKEDGVYLSGTLYPYGTREQYQQIKKEEEKEQKKLKEAEERKDKLLALCNSYFTLNQEYHAFRGVREKREKKNILGFVTDTDYYYSLDDIGESIVITELIVEFNDSTKDYVVQALGKFNSGNDMYGDPFEFRGTVHSEEITTVRTKEYVTISIDKSTIGGNSELWTIVFSEDKVAVISNLNVTSSISDYFKE